MSQREKLLGVIEADLRQDCSDYLSLRGLMQELYGGLLERDSARIDVLNPQIVALVDLLRLRAQRRSKVLAAFGLGQRGEDMLALLAQLPASQSRDLQNVWQQLGNLAEQCKGLNDRNGKLLAMHHDILSQLLDAQADARLYGPQSY